MEKNAKKTLYIFATFLVLYQFTTYCANDMIMPGMVQVVNEFHASLKYVAFSLIFYILGNTILTLFVGPLAEEYGKRRIILGGNIIFVITSFLMLFTFNIHQFLIVRTLEGIGLSVIAVGYTLVNESFDDTEAVKLISLMSNVAILSPLLGPIIGAAIMSILNWRFIFVLIVAMSLLTCIALWRYTPEDKVQVREHKFTLVAIMAMYWQVIKNLDFQFGVLILSLMFLPVLAWIGFAPNIILYKLHLSYFKYIVYQLIAIGGF